MKTALTPPPDLTIPLPGSTTARGVLSRAIGASLGDLGEVLRTIGADPAQRRDVVALSTALARIPDRQAALASVLRRPNVGALVRCARVAGADPALGVELVATLAVELAVMGALGTPLRLERSPARVISLAGRFVLDLPGGSIVVGPDALETSAGPRAYAAARRPFHEIDRGVVLALEDNNPLSMFEAHPDKAGNRVDLGGRSSDEWCRTLRDALACVERYLPELRAEHDLFVSQYVPVGYDAESHLSASYREALGTIYLGLHPQPMTMVEAVIHEFSHNKLNALFELDEVLHNAYSPLYKSPVRPDPRPLHGVLLAVHAFLPVARLYEAMVEADDPLAHHPSFRARFGAIKAKNREGMGVLSEHADPTPVGRALLDELARWDQHFSD